MATTVPHAVCIALRIRPSRHVIVLQGHQVVFLLAVFFPACSKLTWKSSGSAVRDVACSHAAYCRPSAGPSRAATSWAVGAPPAGLPPLPPPRALQTHSWYDTDNTGGHEGFSSSSSSSSSSSAYTSGTGQPVGHVRTQHFLQAPITRQTRQPCNQHLPGASTLA